MSAFRNVLIASLMVCGCTQYVYARDCQFPSRTAKNSFVFVRAGNGGSWEKQPYPHVANQKGFFRFIYYMKGRPYPQNRLYIEAWQYSFSGSERSELFVGCLPVNEKSIFEAVDITGFEFRQGEFDIYLDMKLYDGAGASRAHSIKIPLNFFQSVDY